MADTYKIVRFKFEGRKRTIATGLTLEQAQKHCQNPATKGTKNGKPWFDGYQRER